MCHLIKYRFLQITRNRPMMFWALAFPMILGTLFYISFGNIGISATGDSDWDPVPVAVINKLETKSSGTFFADFLDAMNGSVLDSDLSFKHLYPDWLSVQRDCQNSSGASD